MSWITNLIDAVPVVCPSNTLLSLIILQAFVQILDYHLGSLKMSLCSLLCLVNGHVNAWELWVEWNLCQALSCIFVDKNAWKHRWNVTIEMWTGHICFGEFTHMFCVFLTLPTFFICLSRRGGECVQVFRFQGDRVQPCWEAVVHHHIRLQQRPAAVLLTCRYVAHLTTARV